MLSLLTPLLLPLLLQNPVTAGRVSENLIPNGDFSKGNVGFSSDLPYVKPSFNCLWPGAYTVNASFDRPQLHRLIAPEPFPAPIKRTGKEKVFFANAGGTEPLMIWSTTVKCEPQTKYLISFNCISLSGHIEEGDPPHQVATMEWVPDFVIYANNQASPPLQCGCGKYYKATMLWNSGKSTSATIKIIRDKIAHGAGLIGISNIQMVPVKATEKGSG